MPDTFKMNRNETLAAFEQELTEAIEKLKNTIEQTDTDSDSYNMGWLQGKLTGLETALFLVKDQK